MIGPETTGPLEGDEEPASIAGRERPSEVGVANPARVLQKEDPDSLHLRGQPMRALRFKRELLIGVVAFASIVLAATTWWALAPDRRDGQSLLADDAGRMGSASDTLSGLPRSYDAVPQLGPPLPGDLGRPILKRPQALDAQSATDDGTTSLAARNAAAAQQQAEAELRAARQSALLATSGVRATASIGDGRTVPSSADQPAPTASDNALVDPDRDPNAQEHKMSFMAASDKEGAVNPYRMEPPASPNIVSAGSVIAGSLITGINSDLPGLVTAQVSERVYDSATGRILLIPQGARLIGKYDSTIAYGQNRALIAWQRIIMPDGSSIRLENAPATDAAGNAGLADRVDHHTGRLLTGAAISTLLGVGANMTFSGESDLVQAIREATQQNVARAGDQITQRNLHVQPTITVRPGTPVRLLVHRDLNLPPWKE